MVRFADFGYSWSYSVAARVREQIHGEDSLVMVREFWNKVDDEFIRRALTPQKETYLHELIEFSMKMDIEYTLGKWDYSDSIADIRHLLDDYQIPYSSYSDFAVEDPEEKNYEYTHYLSDLFGEHAAEKVTGEVFTLLFPDRQLLLEMNDVIAGTVRSLKREDYPKLLDRDGMVRRCRNWPKWLSKGVFYRENGLCSLCGSDLTGLLAAGVAHAIDHIVPLVRGGTNDPTNLQLLCTACNQKKSGGQAETSGRRNMYW
ncbi:MAG: HNH endonuclease [Candidatus Krumholzibacteriota bacterium]|nr:HNH endonuclease [Candidatus Krumholzibacteriota bacterium]